MSFLKLSRCLFETVKFQIVFRQIETPKLKSVICKTIFHWWIGSNLDWSSCITLYYFDNSIASSLRRFKVNYVKDILKLNLFLPSFNPYLQFNVRNHCNLKPLDQCIEKNIYNSKNLKFSKALGSWSKFQELLKKCHLFLIRLYNLF